jgi:hypothetical protein
MLPTQTSLPLATPPAEAVDARQAYLDLARQAVARQALGQRLSREEIKAIREATLLQTGDTHWSDRAACAADLGLASKKIEALAAAGTALEGRLAGAESALGARMQALEAAHARNAGLEARTNRVQAIAALRARLDAGQALGPTLAPVPNPPAALSRFASASPPTEAALRLAFEDAARAARAASEPAREGQSILESASARLAGLITIRRGETIIWGDEAAAALEAARRALEAGDLPGALGRLAPLPPAARAALGAWEADAQALLAARAAIITLAGG